MAATSNKTFSYLAIGVVVIAVIFLAYRFWLRPTGSANSDLVGLQPAGFDSSLAGGNDDQFLNLLLSLQAIDLSGTTRVMPLLSKLTDFSTELRPQAPGRSNPFAPVGSDRSVLPAAAAAAPVSATSTVPVD